MTTLLRILRAVFPPAHRHPRRAAHEWVSNANDPYRPLEPGEDWAGNVKTLALCLDFEQVGHYRMRRVVIAA